MAKQSSAFKLEGNIGGLSFYKTRDGHMAREKGGVSKDRIMTDPKYARTRENLKEFSENAKTVKMVKDTIRPAVLRIADSKFHARLIREMMKVLRTDPVNGRGKRIVAEGDWNLIQGFEINSKAVLSGSVKTDITLTNTATEWGFSIDPFMPVDFLSIPLGATHFKMIAAGASFDFQAGTKSFILEAGANLPLEELTGAIAVTIPKAGLPEPNKLFIIGIEFLQVVNGQDYAFNSEEHNAAAIVTVEKV